MGDLQGGFIDVAIAPLGIGFVNLLGGVQTATADGCLIEAPVVSDSEIDEKTPCGDANALAWGNSVILTIQTWAE